MRKIEVEDARAHQIAYGMKTLAGKKSKRKTNL